MSGRLKWYGPKVQLALEKRLQAMLTACLIVVQNRAKVLLSIAGTGKAPGGRDRKGRSRRVYGANPSRPGEPPHKQTGRLRGSVARELVGLIGRVGTNLKYGRWLELGTKRMKPRPWLRRALSESRAQIRAIFAGRRS